MDFIIKNEESDQTQKQPCIATFAKAKQSTAAIIAAGFFARSTDRSIANGAKRA